MTDLVVAFGRVGCINVFINVIIVAIIGMYHNHHLLHKYLLIALKNVAATDNNRPVQGGGNIVWSRESCQTGRCPGVSRGCLVDKPM